MKYNNIIKISTIIIVFILILIPSLHIPMHSDDFSYSLAGNGIHHHIIHYLSWSGRFVTDYISTILLSLNYYLREIINSIAFILLIFFISIIPYAVNDKNKRIWKEFNPVIFCLIFILYWILNPTLGETSFWIVGSANYMWTNLFIVIFFYLLFYNIGKNDSSVVNKMVLIFFSLLAGCSNENTGLIVALISLNIYFCLNRRIKLIFISFIGNIVGYLILILAPGNYKRLESAGLEWYSLPLIERIKIHLFERIPEALSKYIVIFYFILFSLIILYYFFKKIKYKNHIIFIMSFFIGSLFAIILLIGSPYIALRSINGPLVLLLIATSFILFIVSKSKFAKLNIVVLILVLCIFIPSYMYFNNAVYHTKKQDNIRREIILKAIEKNEKTVKIPKFYFTHLWKGSDRFDMYFNGEAMGKYFGINKIIEYPLYFNYSQDIQKQKFLKVNWDMGRGVVIDRIILFEDAPFRLTLLLRMNNNSLDRLPENMGLYIHKYKYKIKTNASKQWESIFEYNEYFYKSTEVASNLDKIQLGVFIYNKEIDSYKNTHIHEVTGDILRAVLKN